MNREAISPLLMLLNIPPLRRMRRNHALEHATVHILSRRVKKLTVVGRSDARGFYLIGNLPTDVVRQSVEEGLQRLRNGERHLAVHPNCGTNLVTTAAIGAGATLIALFGADREHRGHLRRLPLVAAGLMIAIMIGKPLGLLVQERASTLADPGDMQILEIRRVRIAGLTVHRIETTSS